MTGITRSVFGGVLGLLVLTVFSSVHNPAGNWFAKAGEVSANSDLVALTPAEPARVADRLSLALRGVLATDSERQDYVDGRTDLRNLAQSYKVDPRFLSRFSQYWLQVLKIEGPFDFFMVEDKRPGKSGTLARALIPPTTFNQSRALIFRSKTGTTEAPRFELYMKPQVEQVEVDTQRTKCNAMVDGELKNQCLSQLQSIENNRAITVKFREIHDCSEQQAVDIRPWWIAEGEGTVKVCPSVISGQTVVVDRTAPAWVVSVSNTSPTPVICGENLQNCLPYDSRFSISGVGTVLKPLDNSGLQFFDEVYAGLTQEPAMLIARTVQEDLDFRSVLTTSKTYIPGALEIFLKSGAGSVLREQSAGGYVAGSALLPVGLSRASWRWVERGPGNAGVLTTPQYQQATNGYRAKANRAYEAFLCRKFVVPPNVVDGDPLEPDLTKRQPCASCHVELEPLANMFKRWPETGTNFLYNPSLKAVGHFHTQPDGNKEIGEDATGFGSILTKDSRFTECAVHRAFEFLTGEAPTEFDIERNFPKWEQLLRDNGFRLWPVMLDIIDSAYFRGGRK